MQARLRLAALDHNSNPVLGQALTKKGVPRFKLRYSKAAKSYTVAQVKEAKSTDYRNAIMKGITITCAEGKHSLQKCI